MELLQEFKFVTMFINILYALFSGTMTIIFMIIAYKIFDTILPFNMNSELDDGNVAIGLVVGSIFIGIGIAIGLCVGLALN